VIPRTMSQRFHLVSLISSNCFKRFRKWSSHPCSNVLKIGSSCGRNSSQPEWVKISLVCSASRKSVNVTSVSAFAAAALKL
jgi:hypothetical protein